MAEQRGLSRVVTRADMMVASRAVKKVGETVVKRADLLADWKGSDLVAY